MKKSLYSKYKLTTAIPKKRNIGSQASKHFSIQIEDLAELQDDCTVQIEFFGS